MLDIKHSMLNEARSAPNLFRDLAKVELYISESYRTRAFVELLQNSDDANASRFNIELVGEKLFVANNGLIFTSSDISALCRSGASTKFRGDGKIGYRGIGFKSVVGISNSVLVVSGDFAFSFSKEKTKKITAFEEDVPMIRIPHEVDTSSDEFIEAKKYLEKTKSNTVFVFGGLNHRLIEQEIKSFDESTILFLKHTTDITIKVGDVSKCILKESSCTNSTAKIHVNDSEKSNWLIVSNMHMESVAFKLLDGEITDCEKQESVVHSFLPTHEYAGARIKINGDFGTDPSRKYVDYDEQSDRALDGCASLIQKLIQNCLNSLTYGGIFSPFENEESGKFKSEIRKKLADRFSSGILFNNISIKPEQIRTKPDWINYDDYCLMEDDFFCIPKKYDEFFTKIHEFLNWIGAHKLSEMEAVRSKKLHLISTIGSSQLLARLASRHRFDLSQELKTELMNAKILPTESGLRAPSDIHDISELKTEFIDALHKSQYYDDIRVLLKRLNASIAIPSAERKQMAGVTHNTLPTGGTNHPGNISYPAITKWRSAELNTKTWISSIPGVISATDVSKSHVGYDIEVLLKNGSRYFIEVKSVGSFGEEIEITNNELAVATQYGDKYILAFVKSGDSFEIKFVSNPMKTLEFEKRIKVVSWCCDTYNDYLTTNFFDETK